jgi:hypothetical protein
VTELPYQKVNAQYQPYENTVCCFEKIILFSCDVVMLVISNKLIRQRVIQTGVKFSIISGTLLSQ